MRCGGKDDVRIDMRSRKQASQKRPVSQEQKGKETPQIHCVNHVPWPRSQSSTDVIYSNAPPPDSHHFHLSGKLRVIMKKGPMGHTEWWGEPQFLPEMNLDLKTYTFPSVMCKLLSQILPSPKLKVFYEYSPGSKTKLWLKKNERGAREMAQQSGWQILQVPKVKSQHYMVPLRNTMHHCVCFWRPPEHCWETLMAPGITQLEKLHILTPKHCLTQLAKYLWEWSSEIYLGASPQKNKRKEKKSFSMNSQTLH